MFSLFIQLFVFLLSSSRHLFISYSRSLSIFIISVLKSFACAPAKLFYSGPAVIGLLGSRGGIVSWLFMFLFLC